MDKYVKRENLKAELAFMRELFFDSLPLGEKKDEIEKYFSYLEEAICTNDPDEFERERFPEDDPTACGDRVYKYHSAALFKEHASIGQVQPVECGSWMGNSKDAQAELPATETASAEISHLERLQKRASGHQHCRQGERRQVNPCPDIQGQLDT